MTAIARRLKIGRPTVERYLAGAPDGDTTPAVPENGNAPAPQATRPTAPRTLPVTQNLSEAVIVTIQPRRFEMNSIILWQAMEATVREWDWPVMPPADWLATYLYESFRQRGIVLDAYTVTQIPNDMEETDGSEGHP